jgi:hypothetical protein
MRGWAEHPPTNPGRFKPIDLRRMEYELLTHLARDPRRVFNKHELLQAVWGFPADLALSEAVSADDERGPPLLRSGCGVDDDISDVRDLLA